MDHHLLGNQHGRRRRPRSKHGLKHGARWTASKHKGRDALMGKQERIKQIADALIADPRYGAGAGRERKNKPKPKLKITPKGTNPLKGKYGFLAEYIF